MLKKVTDKEVSKVVGGVAAARVAVAQTAVRSIPVSSIPIKLRVG